MPTAPLFSRKIIVLCCREMEILPISKEALFTAATILSMN